MTRPSNILMVSFDALRRDFVSAYNPEAENDTNLFDRAAASGTVFNRALGNGNWTVPSHASLFTGLESQAHEIFNWKIRIPLETDTIFDRALNAGYRCAFMSSEGVMLLADNRKDRFEHFGDTFCGAHDEIHDGEKPWCVFWHFLDTHAPYNMKAPRKAHLDKTDWQVADNTINWLRELICTDQTEKIIQQIHRNIELVGGLVDDLWSRLGDDTVVALMSDHGEDFRKHMPFHCSFEASVLRIPMIVSAPGLKPANNDSLISHSDIAHLVWELAHASSDIERNRLINATTASQAKGRVSISGPDAFDNGEVFFAASTNDDIVISKPSTGDLQHFAMHSDQRTRVSSDTNPDEFGSLEKSLKDIVAEFQEGENRVQEKSDADVDVLLEQLERLGYIS